MMNSDSILIDEALLKRFNTFVDLYDIRYPELSNSDVMTYTRPTDIDVDLAMLRDVPGVVTKKMIMELFGVEDVKARGILIDMMRFDCAFQLGKTYYTTKEHCEHYIRECMGQTRKVL